MNLVVLSTICFKMCIFCLPLQITEVRDFAGEEIKVKKLVDAESKEAAEKARGSSTSAVGHG